MADGEFIHTEKNRQTSRPGLGYTQTLAGKKKRPHAANAAATKGKAKASVE